MSGNTKVENATTILCQNQKHVQHLKPDRRYREEVDGNHTLLFPALPACCVFSTNTPTQLETVMVVLAEPVSVVASLSVAEIVIVWTPLPSLVVSNAKS